MKTRHFYLVFFFLFIIFESAKAQFQFLFPMPGSEDHSTNCNIVIREGNRLKAASLIGNDLFKITGSESGMHSFDVILSRDKKTILLKPQVPFAEDETVRVDINAGIEKENGQKINEYSFSFKTTPKLTPELSQQLERDLKRVYEDDFGKEDELSNDIYQHGLPPVYITVNNNPAPGDIFFHNYNTNGVPTGHWSIISNDGDSVFSKASERRGLDFKINHNGYLTMYDKTKLLFKMYDSSYNFVANYKIQNGYLTDPHEFLIFPDGHSYLMGYSAHIVDMTVYDSSYSSHATVIELVVQELDSDLNAIFSWRSQDHISVTEAPHENLSIGYIDYVHGNSIEEDADGNLIISCRHLDQIDKIDINTGEFIWRLGGKENQFTFINDPEPFNYQHDCRRLPNGNITLFDNGNYHNPPCSYAREYKLDEVNKKAVLVWYYKHHKIAGANVFGTGLGSVQRLANGNTLIDWGWIAMGSQFPNLTEVTPDGNIAWEMRLDNMFGDIMYRAHKYEWNPCARPTGYKLKSTNITSSSVKLSWSPATGAASYILQYRILGTLDWNLKFPSAGQHVFHLSQLQPETEYEWRMRSVCAAGDSSLFSIIGQFTTLPLKIMDTEADDVADISSQLFIYPNPSSSEISVRLPLNEDDYEIYLINSKGQIVFQDKYDQMENPDVIKVNVSQFPSGVYAVELHSSQLFLVSKMVKQ